MAIYDGLFENIPTAKSSGIWTAVYLIGHLRLVISEEGQSFFNWFRNGKISEIFRYIFLHRLWFKCQKIKFFDFHNFLEFIYDATEAKLLEHWIKYSYFSIIVGILSMRLRHRAGRIASTPGKMLCGIS